MPTLAEVGVNVIATEADHNCTYAFHSELRRAEPVIEERVLA